MKQSKIIEELRAIRQRMYEEEKRLGRDDFLRRERERVREFLERTAPWLIPKDWDAPPGS